MGWLDGWRDGHQDTHITVRLDPMGFADVTDEDITRFSRKSALFLAQELSFPLNDGDAHLSLDFMGMDGQALTSLEIEINDFEVRRIVDKRALVH